MEATDEELMESYAHGDRQSFQKLYERYEKRLQGFLFRRLGDRNLSAATDLFQITWLKIHEARKRFDRTKKFSAWLFTIAINSLRDHQREARWKYEISSDNSVFDNLKFNKDEDVSKRFELRQLEEALPQLTPPHREILLLCDLEGFSSKEVSEMMGTTDANIRQTLVRSRQKIKEILKADNKNYG